jgi:hypothetical protein
MKVILMCQVDYVHTVILITSLELRFGSTWLVSFLESRCHCMRVLSD